VDKEVLPAAEAVPAVVLCDKEPVGVKGVDGVKARESEEGRECVAVGTGGTAEAVAVVGALREPVCVTDAASDAERDSEDVRVRADGDADAVSVGALVPDAECDGCDRDADADAVAVMQLPLSTVKAVLVTSPTEKNLGRKSHAVTTLSTHGPSNAIAFAEPSTTTYCTVTLDEVAAPAKRSPVLLADHVERSTDAAESVRPLTMSTPDVVLLRTVSFDPTNFPSCALPISVTLSKSSVLPPSILVVYYKLSDSVVPAMTESRTVMLDARFDAHHWSL
jgi:hypothetical protein